MSNLLFGAYDGSLKVFRKIFSFIIFFPLCHFAWYFFTSPFGSKSQLKKLLMRVWKEPNLNLDL
jgi:hypothetical protein